MYTPSFWVPKKAIKERKSENNKEIERKGKKMLHICKPT